MGTAAIIARDRADAQQKAVRRRPARLGSRTSAPPESRGGSRERTVRAAPGCAWRHRGPRTAGAANGHAGRKRRLDLPSIESREARAEATREVDSGARAPWQGKSYHWNASCAGQPASDRRRRHFGEGPWSPGRVVPSPRPAASPAPARPSRPRRPRSRPARSKAGAGQPISLPAPRFVGGGNRQAHRPGAPARISGGHRHHRRPDNNAAAPGHAPQNISNSIHRHGYCHRLHVTRCRKISRRVIGRPRWGLRPGSTTSSAENWS
jgi:hypothetical protein